MTKEHIWSDWLSKVLPPSADHSQQIIRLHLDSLGQEARIYPTLPISRQGSLGQKKIRRVCNNCNSGWMSKVVESAKPFAEPMVKGACTNLDPLAQRRLSAWIAITAVMAEFTDLKTQSIMPSDYENLRKFKAPPLDWTISVGCYEGESWSPLRYRHYGGRILQRTRAVPMNTVDYAQTTTFTVGALLVQVFTSTISPLIYKYRSSYLPEGMFPIWPRFSSHVAWPAKPVASDDDVERIADVHFDVLG